MKLFGLIRKLMLSLIVMAIVSLFAMVSLSGPYKDPQDAGTEPPPSPSLPPLDQLLPEGPRADADMMLHVLSGGEIVEMSMERYLIGVVAAEMPAGFPLEALKAQSIAARTIVLYNIQVTPSQLHPQADACTDYKCCMAFLRDDQLREGWGDSYLDNIMRIISAVVGTDGVYMLYDNEPILALFHSSSAGKTESSGNVWMTDLPYLVSVDSPESSADDPNYIKAVSVSGSDFKDIITESYPDAVFGDDAGLWITDIAYTESGRILELTIGGAVVKGTELRSMFDLRSTAITIEISDNNIIFTVTGYGHGVGMSQYGAASMARDGKQAKEILSVYYEGVVFSDAP